jgi:cell division protease FtsH
LRGREQILKVHMRKVPISKDVEPLVIARGTPGFSGADLANLVNEAALFAARYSDKKVDQSHFDLAKDKIMMGPERKSMILSDEHKRITAYHEAGHAIVGRLMPEHDPVYKVTIIPRGRALGVTMFLPEEDKYMQSRQYLLGRISALFGGRIAEEIINGKDGITTGASNDIDVATGIATNMVTKWGLSSLGPLKYGDEDTNPFLGKSAAMQNQTFGAETSNKIDAEIKKIIDDSYSKAKKLLNDNLEKLHVMADALLKYETIDADQIDDIMAGAEPREPKDWNDDDKPKKTSSKDSSIKGPAEEL